MMNEPLSERGQRRRQQILLMAQGVARGRRRRRSIGRGVGVAAMFAVAGLTAWSLTQLRSNPLPRSLPVVVVLPAPLPPSSESIQYIATDPTITDRLTIKPQPPRWTSIGNEELLQELAAAGQPAGIVCMNGKTFLLPRGGAAVVQHLPTN